ncbi:hypothetical protein [uncultured Pseudodesulfovibrio sp.]|uniref:hypothetical protein n=1 Tax=uncultured Pseudodesulfovibrio sp. TaxID=2035858 RepID=UPI0029C95F20|nr:hypothetical protein [uncultured Pseudodesulfovibrio sp.]
MATERNLIKLSINVFDFKTKNVANVLIRIVDTKKVIGVYRCNPLSLELPQGTYGFYISGENYDTAFRAVNVYADNNVSLELPIYPVGTMPPAPATPRDMPVHAKGADMRTVSKIVGIDIPTKSIAEETIDGPVFMDYRNKDGYIFTTKINVENEPIMSMRFGEVPTVIMAWCGNNTWREMGSPRN